MVVFIMVLNLFSGPFASGTACRKLQETVDDYFGFADWNWENFLDSFLSSFKTGGGLGG